MYVGTIESNVHKQISRHLSEILTSQLDVCSVAGYEEKEDDSEKVANGNVGVN